jgi:hypothetical protein
MSKSSYMPGRAGRRAWELIDRLAAAAGNSPDKLIYSGLPNYGSSEPHVYTPNASCWAASLDFTCVSPWSAGQSCADAVTAVSPLHVIATAHASPPGTWPSGYDDPPGYAVDFVTRAGLTVTRKILAEVTVNGSSGLKVCKLDIALPATIVPAKVLPLVYRDLMGMPASDFDYLNLPYIWFDRPRFSPDPSPHNSRWANIGDAVHSGTPASSAYAAGYAGPTPISGDSGTPFLLYFDPAEPVLLAGPSMASPMNDAGFDYRTGINAAMATLGGGYQLIEVNLAAHCAKWS